MSIFSMEQLGLTETQRKTAEERKIVKQYEQICTNHQRIAVRADGSYLTACDIDFPLEH